MPGAGRSLRGAFMPSLLLVSLAGLSTAQQCFFPDGSTSTHTPCGKTASSACCPDSAYCMDNGLCFTGGILIRGSCTDENWDDDACPTVCRTNSPNVSEPIVPCSNGHDSSATFACGTSMAACQTEENVFSLHGTGSIVLRTSQLQTLTRQVTHSAGANVSSNSTSCFAADGTPLYTGGALAGLGLGLGIPLLMALAALFILLRRQRRQGVRGTMKPKLMYRLPDDHEEFEFRATSRGRPRGGSDVTSLRTMTSMGTEAAPPAHMKTFLERYQAMSEKGKSQVPAVELPGSMMAHELADRRRSGHPTADMPNQKI